MDTTIRKIALDLGNGNMKGALVIDAPVIDPDTGEALKGKDGQPKTEKKLVTATLPSQVGVGNTEMGQLDLGGLEKRKRKSALPVAVRFDGGDYLVGHNVARYARLLERLDANRYTDSMEVRALTYALLAQLLDGGPSDIAAIIALPVHVVMAANAKDTIKAIEGWLLGEHNFIYDGTPASVTVHAVRVMAQPAGAFFAWGLNEGGQWTRSEEDLTTANVAVLDSGYSTLDLLFIKQGRIEKRFTGGDTLGVRRAVEEIQRVVKAQHGATLARAEVDGYIRAYLDKKSVTLIVNGRKHDLKPAIRQALNSLATLTADYVDNTWGGELLSYALLTGGGALALSEHIQRLLPQAQLLPDPITANAAGLAKLAQRPGVFKGLP